MTNTTPLRDKDRSEGTENVPTSDHQMSTADGPTMGSNNHSNVGVYVADSDTTPSTVNSTPGDMKKYPAGEPGRVQSSAEPRVPTQSTPPILVWAGAIIVIVLIIYFLAQLF